MVSETHICVGETQTNIKTFELPLRDELSNHVNFELRYGTCLLPDPRLAITSPNADRLLLILCASLSLSPLASVLLIRSLPARSIKFKEEIRVPKVVFSTLKRLV